MKTAIEIAKIVKEVNDAKAAQDTVKAEHYLTSLILPKIEQVARRGRFCTSFSFPKYKRVNLYYIVESLKSLDFDVEADKKVIKVNWLSQYLCLPD